MKSKACQFNLQVCLLICMMRNMSAPLDTASISREMAVTELSLAIGKLVRRLRMEANPGELSWSQTAALARLEKAGSMTTAELARGDRLRQA